MNQPKKPYDKWIQLKMSSVNNWMTFEVETFIEQKFPEAHALNNVTMSLSDAFHFFVSFVVYWSTIAVSIAYWLIIDTIISIIGKINERWNSKYDVSFMNLHVCVSQTQKFCNVDLNESFEHICT